MHVSDKTRHWPGYGAVWRWHFYAGLFCIPFILWLACTGSIYLWRPQIEALIDRPYANVSEGSSRASAAAIAQAAEHAVTGSVLHRYQLPETARQAVQVIVGRGTRETRVYVNPQTLGIFKTVNEEGRLMPTIFYLHGELLLGDKGSYVVELAASWAIIMIISGLFLWWPRGSGLAGVVYPRLGAHGRPFWRDLHAVAGFWVSLFALGFLISGLPWATSWGANLQAIRAVTTPGASAPDWTTGQDGVLRQRAAADRATRDSRDPHAGHRGMILAVPRVDHSPLDRLVPVVAALRLASPVLIAPPTGVGQPWTAKSDAQDRALRAELTLDGDTGRILTRHDFKSRPLVDRIVDYGVAAHEGQLFGLANQLLNMFVAIGLATLAISGSLLWWRRKPGDVLGAPPARNRPPVAIGFVVLLAVLGALLPVLGASMIVVLLAERLLLRRIPAARRWLGLRAAAT
uniref:PepSY-associated TM helix domain-containing protein n=1 Tax=uncultured Sphingomonas sp. TaxID=158754 RepID=UPI0035CB0985